MTRPNYKIVNPERLTLNMIKYIEHAMFDANSGNRGANANTSLFAANVKGNAEHVDEIRDRLVKIARVFKKDPWMIEVIKSRMEKYTARCEALERIQKRLLQNRHVVMHPSLLNREVVHMLWSSMTAMPIEPILITSHLGLPPSITEFSPAALNALREVVVAAKDYHRLQGADVPTVSQQETQANKYKKAMETLLHETGLSAALKPSNASAGAELDIRESVVNATRVLGKIHKNGEVNTVSRFTKKLEQAP